MSWQDYPCILVEPNHKGYRITTTRLDGKRRSVLAHRLAFRKHYGHWPVHDCGHRCHKKNCMEPQHLYDCEQSENTRDGVLAGLIDAQWLPLSDDQKNSILSLRSNGWPYRKIARHTGVGYGSVQRLCQRGV